MPIATVRIHELLWDGASELRRAEWRTLIIDLLDEATLFEHRAATLLHFEPHDGGVTLHTDEPNFGPFDLWDAALHQHTEEYLATIRQLMDENIHPMRHEAIDMAKRVVHDQAARALASRVPDLSASHEAHRRLFSLLVSLRTDTTQLAVAHRHGR